MTERSRNVQMNEEIKGQPYKCIRANAELRKDINVQTNKTRNSRKNIWTAQQIIDVEKKVGMLNQIDETRRTCEKGTRELATFL